LVLFSAASNRTFGESARARRAYERAVLRLAAAFVTAAALLALAPSAGSQSAVLLGVVGPDFEIALAHADGSPVTQLDPGTYTVEVDDRSSEHNFRLRGPGNVNVATAVQFVGHRTFTVTLIEGEYTYQCDPHLETMRETFRVGNPPPPPPPPPARPAARNALVATVGPRATIGLRTSSGAHVHSVRAGRYRIAVRDRSRAHNFHLYGAGVNRRTGVAFRGTVRWTVRFRRGKVYRFRCDSHARSMRGSFRAR
jgi:plastocyanin